MGENGVQYLQVDRAAYGGGQGRLRDNRVPNMYGAGTKSEKVQFIRQLQQLQQQQKQLKKRMAVFVLFTWIILAVNIAIVAAMFLRVQSVNEALGNRRTAVEPEGGGVLAEPGEWLSGSEADKGQEDSGFGGQDGLDYVSLCGLEHVDRPRERTGEEVLARLDELASEDQRIAEILEDSWNYPDKLLEALANNPEMADFVAGYHDSGRGAGGGLTREEKKQEFPLFLQWDPRWGYEEYGDGSNIGLAGCGPTCLSMALYYLTGNETLTPDKMAEYSMENGYYISGTGTAWALLQDVPGQYGVEVSQPRTEEASMKAALDEKSVIICSMGPGDFTAAGHFIVIYGYDKKGFLVNDPNCVARSRQHWGFDELKGQIKNIWVLGSGAKYGGISDKDVTSVTDYGYGSVK